MKAGEPVDRSVIFKAAPSFNIVDFEDKGACIVRAWRARSRAMVNNFVPHMRSPRLPASLRRRRRKQKATAKHTSSALGCYAKARNKNLPVESACLDSR